jgi:hypothetical protein
MKSRFALRITLPLVLLAVAFAAVLLAGRDSDAALQARAQNTGTGMPYVSFSDDEKPDSSAPDTSQWAAASMSLDGVSVTYRHPANWSPQLTYCAPGAKTGQEGGHLPAGCASTDFLVGQKAQDVGRIEGTPLKVGDMSAARLVESAPPSVVVSQIYTVMVYEESGAPLFGVSTLVGYDTDPATVGNITNTLDAIVGTMRVEVSR